MRTTARGTAVDDYPAWICRECGHKHGRVTDGVATFHTGDECGWCGRNDIPVTEPRDYGYPPMSRKS